MASRSQPDFISRCVGPESIQDEIFHKHEINPAHIVAKKMNDLSVEERERAIHDLHGLGDACEESDEFVAKKLGELDLEVKNIPNKCALELAKRKSLDYVINMRLMFLRSERFDPQLAAKKIVHFFEFKLGLFGEEKLVKDITWWDLTEEDKAFMEQGGLQLLPLRDRAGRAVLMRIAVIFSLASYETQARLLFFIFMKALEDEEVQKRGMVLIGFNVGMDSYKPEGSMAIWSTVGALPVKMSGLHVCYDNPLLENLVKITQSILSKKLFGNGAVVMRFRSHFGTHVECLYELMTYGIMRDVIPITATGEVDLQFHKVWVERIKIRAIENSTDESQEVSRKKIIIPGPMDIILGRGSHAKDSPGTLRFRHLLETHRQHYDSLDKRERKTVTRSLLGELKEGGVRFIKGDDQGGYTEILEKEAIAKISHGFRNLRTHVESSNASMVEKNSKKKRSSAECDGNASKTSLNHRIATVQFHCPFVNGK